MDLLHNQMSLATRWMGGNAWGVAGSWCASLCLFHLGPGGSWFMVPSPPSGFRDRGWRLGGLGAPWLCVPMGQDPNLPEVQMAHPANHRLRSFIAKILLSDLVDSINFKQIFIPFSSPFWEKNISPPPLLPALASNFLWLIESDWKEPSACSGFNLKKHQAFLFGFVEASNFWRE